MKAYHFLKDDMHGGYGKEKKWEIGEEREIKQGKIKLCKRGYHSAPGWYDALGYAQGGMACIVEVSEPVEKDATKFVSRKRKLIDARDATHVLREWGCSCAERALKKAKVTDERSWNAIKTARLYNKGEATKEELDAAYSAADSAAYYAAHSAAYYAAYSAAYSAAYYAARYAAYSAEIKWQKRELNKLMKELFGR